MTTYGTLSEKMNELRRDGYTKDFNLSHTNVDSRNEQLNSFSKEFKVDKYYRFEGASNPSDAAILYAISSDDKKVKGLLVNAYGIYSDAITDELIRRIGFRQK
jgi:hypothetical protein